MTCTCTPCDECNGSGVVYISADGRYLGRNRCDDMDDMQSCYQCDRTGIDMMCDECIALELEEEHYDMTREQQEVEEAELEKIAAQMADAIREWNNAKKERESWVPVVGQMPLVGILGNAKKANAMLTDALIAYDRWCGIK
jgi:ssDNA-binding Zn-finger/Zn-ribbon topoisomerase 1